MSKGENFRNEIDTTRKRRARKIGLGLGAAALGVATMFGTGEKKKTEPIEPPKISSPARKIETPAFSPRLTQEDLKKMRGVFARAEQASAPEIGEPEKAKNQYQQAEVPKEQPVAQEVEFLRETARANPAYFLRDHLSALKGLREAKDILLIINAAGWGGALFEFLPKIHKLGILSEEDFIDFTKEMVEKNPKAYLKRFKSIDAYLPQDPETIVHAIESDPSFLIQPSYIEPDDVIKRAIESHGDTLLKQIYALLTNRESQEYQRYDSDEKDHIASLFPLIEEGKMTVNEAAGIEQKDPIGYWQRLAQAANLAKEAVSTPAARELKSIVNALINYGDPNGPELQAIEDRFLKEEVEALIAYAKSGINSSMGDVYERLFKILQQKTQK